jgi:hypothetical protein
MRLNSAARRNASPDHPGSQFLDGSPACLGGRAGGASGAPWCSASHVCRSPGTGRGRPLPVSVLFQGTWRWHWSQRPRFGCAFDRFSEFQCCSEQAAQSIGRESLALFAAFLWPGRSQPRALGLVDSYPCLYHHPFDIGEIAHCIGNIERDEIRVIAFLDFDTRVVQQAQCSIRQVNRLLPALLCVCWPPTLRGRTCCHSADPLEKCAGRFGSMRGRLPRRARSRSEYRR